jgi:thioredoxin
MDFEKLVYNNPNPVVVMLGASWCSPCKMMKPIFASLKNEWADRIPMFYLDMDDDANKEFSEKHGVSSIPTIVLFKGGTEVARLSGRQSERAIVDLLKSA